MKRFRTTESVDFAEFRLSSRESLHQTTSPDRRAPNWPTFAGTLRSSFYCSPSLSLSSKSNYFTTNVTNRPFGLLSRQSSVYFQARLKLILLVTERERDCAFMNLFNMTLACLFLEASETFDVVRIAWCLRWRIFPLTAPQNLLQCLRQFC